MIGLIYQPAGYGRKEGRNAKRTYPDRSHPAVEDCHKDFVGVMPQPGAVHTVEEGLRQRDVTMNSTVGWWLCSRRTCHCEVNYEPRNQLERSTNNGDHQPVSQW